MEFAELLAHLGDLHDLAMSEGFVAFAHALDDVATFVESMPERFDQRLIASPAVRPPIAIVARNDLAQLADDAATDEEIAEEIDRTVAALERERRRAARPKILD